MASKYARDPCNENVVNTDNVLHSGTIRPVLDFPRSQFGTNNYRFQEGLYLKYDWIEYRIFSFKRRGVYKIPEVSGAAYIGRRRLLEGGVYICINVSLLI